MPLKSKLFSGDRALEACLTQDAAHVTQGACGEHVAKIQTAVSVLNGYTIASTEIANRCYGRSTAAAVLNFKKKHSIINRAYQSQADNIVGKMTMAALDQAMVDHESRPEPLDPPQPFYYYT